MQDWPAAVVGLVGAVAGDFVPPVVGGPGDTASNSLGGPGATSVDFPDRLVDKPDRKRSCADDNHAGVGAGMRADRILFDEDDTERIERLAGSSDNGALSSGGFTENEGSFSGSAITVRDPILTLPP